MTDNKPRPTSEADLGNRLAAANWHLVKLVAGALVRIPQSHIARCNVQRAAILPLPRPRAFGCETHTIP
jgi:hypothetical protein